MSCETGAEELADNQMNIYHVLFTKKNSVTITNIFLFWTPVWNILEVLITYTSR